MEAAQELGLPRCWYQVVSEYQGAVQPESSHVGLCPTGFAGLVTAKKFLMLPKTVTHTEGISSLGQTEASAVTSDRSPITLSYLHDEYLPEGPVKLRTTLETF